VDGPPHQDAFQAILLLGIEVRGAAGGWLGLDSCGALLEEGSLPTPHGSPLDTKPASDVYRGESLFKQKNGLLATLFQLDWAAGWSHAMPPAQSIGH
jgi:hypothetical protein